MFGACDCKDSSCPKQAADVAVVLDATQSMGKYFNWIEDLVKDVEDRLKDQGLGTQPRYNCIHYFCCFVL